MTRIGMMTFLRNDNYGSILQAWALQQTLLGLGFDAVHIDYAPSKQEKLRNLLCSGNSPKLIWEGMRKKSATGKMRGGFDKFRTSQLRTTAPCRDRAALTCAAENFDVLLCGSDQIWSPVWLNPAYFLNFTDKPKVAYAPSLGVKQLPGAAKRRKIARMVQGYSALSVREEEGAALLRQMAGVEAAVLPDPVLLLPRERWLSLMDATQGQQPYILCYFIGDAPDYWHTVRRIAVETSYPVRVIPRTEGARHAAYPLEEDVPPARWLSLIGGAARVVTDSFHGAAFSALLNRSCTIIRRYREDDPEGKNSRIDQLLRLLEADSLESPDWAAINARLSAQAAAARSWLTAAINQAAP
ncbi:MAG: polysaccharide pyruvyl transferase family protein [Clostridiales bacterium]|nr:polysaccharide pyruvyl transferase family protein [Clostridiales bacterium]